MIPPEGGKRRNLGRGLSALLGDDQGDYARLEQMRSSRTVAVDQLRPGRFQPRRLNGPGVRYFESAKILHFISISLSLDTVFSFYQFYHTSTSKTSTVMAENGTHEAPQRPYPEPTKTGKAPFKYPKLNVESETAYFLWGG